MSFILKEIFIEKKLNIVFIITIINLMLIILNLFIMLDIATKNNWIKSDSSIFSMIPKTTNGGEILNDAQTVINETSSQMDAMTIGAHNSQLEGYTTGALVKGSVVKSLITKMYSYNTKITDEKYAVSISVLDSNNSGKVLNNRTLDASKYSYINDSYNYIGKVTSKSTDGIIMEVMFIKQ